MVAFLDEEQVEIGLIELLQDMGCAYAYGPDIACDGDHSERSSYLDVAYVIAAPSWPGILSRERIARVMRGARTLPLYTQPRILQASATRATATM